MTTPTSAWCVGRHTARQLSHVPSSFACVHTRGVRRSGGGGGGAGGEWGVSEPRDRRPGVRLPLPLLACLTRVSPRGRGDAGLCVRGTSP